MATYELKIAVGSLFTWSGKDGTDAAVRYADAHRETAVIAWREPRVQLRIGY